jgi:uncharacterized membrane protein
MKLVPGIGYHSPVTLMSRKVALGKYMGLAFSVLMAILGFMSKQYILLIWSCCIGIYIGYDLRHEITIQKTLKKQEDAIDEYVRTTVITSFVDSDEITFKIGDENIKKVCSFDAISHADELLRTYIVCIDDEFYLRVRLISRDKIHVQARHIPDVVAADLWETSQRKRAESEGLEAPF